jgi:hypothetical protein
MSRPGHRQAWPECREAQGDTQTARTYWHRALHLYETLAVPEAELARTQLAALTAWPEARHM